MNRRCSLNRRPILACVAWAVSIAPVLAADPKPAATELRYRRVLVPAAQPESWPTAGVKYIPVEASEFERRVAADEAAPPLLQPPGPAVIEKAAYRASVTDTGLVGDAVLTVRHVGEGQHELALTPSQIAIQSAAWADGTDAEVVAVAGRPAAVLVKRSGELKLKWSLKDVAAHDQQRHFRLSLPPCPRSVLTLDVPADLRPITDVGVVTAFGDAQGDTQQWRLELGGHNNVSIRLLAARVDKNRGANLVRQALSYDFSPRGVEVSGELRIDALGEPLKQIELRIDSRLTLALARLRDIALPWSADKGEDGKASTVILTLPEPLQGAGHVLRIAAVGDVQLNDRFQLPEIRAANLQWEEGSAELLVPRPLILSELLTEGCRQSAVQPLAQPDEGEMYSLQYFVPDAKVEITLSEQDARLQVGIATAVEVATRESTARFVADFQAQQGEQYSIEGQLHPLWLIDSVESSPADVLLDWQVEGPPARGGKLTVRLARPIRPQRPVRLVVTGRRRGAAIGEAISVGQLAMLELRDVRRTSNLLNIRHTGPHQVQFVDEEGSRSEVAVSTLTAAQLERFPVAPTGLLLDANRVRSAMLTLTRQPAQFTVTIVQEVTSAGDRLVEAYNIRCNSQAVQPEKVLVHFSHRSEEPLVWADPVSARRLSEESQQQLGYTSGETWEVSPRRELQGPLILSARRTRPLERNTPVTLAAVHEASSQRGKVLLYATEPSKVRFQTRLQPALTDQPAAGQYSRLVGAYSYDPGRDAVQDAEAIISAAPTTAAGAPKAWAWSSQHQTRSSTTGTAVHTITYYIENRGQPQIELNFPSGVSPGDVWVGTQKTVPQFTSPTAPDRCTVALPAGDRFPAVTIQYTTEDALPVLAGRVTFPAPEISIPVLSRQWTLWLPVGFDTLSAADGSGYDRSHSSWSQRLFGPLGRAEDQLPFDPFDATAWRAIGGSDKIPADAEELIRRLGRDVSEGSRTWGEVLANALLGDEDPELHRPLLIDGNALAPADPLPQRSSKVAGGRDELETGLACLEAAGLVLIVLPEHILLTTQLQSAMLTSVLSPTVQNVVQIARSNADLGPVLASERALEVDRWVASPLDRRVHWRIPAFAATGFSPGPLWRAYQTPIARVGTPTVFVVHRNLLQASGFLFMLPCAALGWTLARRLRRWLIIVGLLVVVALLVPTPLVDLPAGGVLGMLLGLICHLTVQPNFRGITLDRQESGARQAIVPGIGTLLVLAIGTAASVAQSPERSTETVWHVLVPVDESDQHEGTHYYLPEPLYRTIFSRDPGGANANRWMIASAHYEGAVQRDVASGRLAIGEVTARYRLRIANAGEVRLPIGGAGIHIIPDSVKLDRAEVRFRWDEETTELVVQVQEPGTYELEVRVRPTAVQVGNAWEFHLTVPPVASATAAFDLPAGVLARIPSAIGISKRDDTASKLVVDLGAAHDLHLTWGEQGLVQDEQPVFDVDSLYWLRVKPGSVVLDARYAVRVIDGPADQLRLTVDPRLRLLPPVAGANPAAYAVQQTPGSSDRLTLDLTEPIAEAATLPVSFLLTGSSGVGNLRLPRLELEGARSNTRRLAVSVDPALELVTTNGGTAMPVADFMTRWGGGDPKPAAVFLLEPSGSGWSIATRARQPSVRARQKVLWAVGPNESSFTLLADLTISGGHCFQHQLQLPRDVKIEQATAYADTTLLKSRWSQSTSGLLSLFLPEPATGAQRLVIHGRLLHPTGADVTLPAIGVQRSELESQQTILVREPATAVRILSKRDHEEVATAVEASVLREAVLGELMTPELADRVRWIGTYSTTHPGAELRLKVSAARPKVSASQVTRLTRVDDQWQSTTDIVYQVSRGVVDTLRIELPADWSDQAQVDSAAASEVSMNGAPGQRQLVVRPHSPLRESFHLRIRSKLNPSAGGKVQAPYIKPQHVSELRSFLALPTEIDSRHVIWSTTGLRHSELPNSLIELTGGIENYSLLEAVAEGYNATLRSIEPIAGSARVHLADIAITWTENEQCYGIATFDLEPAGMAACELSVPEGYQVVSATVDMLPAVMEPLGSLRYRIQTGPPQLPQRIQVIFSGQLPAGADPYARRLQSPMLVDVPVLKTLWKLQGPGEKPVEPRSETMLPQVQPHVIRARTIMDLAEAASGFNLDQGAEETFRWYRPWLRRFLDARSSIDAARTASVDAISNEMLAEIAEVDERQASLSARLGATELYSQLVAEPRGLDNASGIWRFAAGDGLPTWVEVSGRSSELLVVEGPAAAPPVFEQLLAAALATCLLVLILAFRPLRAAVAASVQRWPAAMGVCLGVFWWLYLWPSILGLAIVLISVLMSSRSSGQPAEERGLEDALYDGIG